ncbi:ATR, partial [Symbiodinium sp. KB8]
MSRLHEMVLQEMQAEHAAAEWITDPAQLPVAVITQACLQVGAHARAVRYWEQFLRTAAGTPFQSAVQLTGAGKENPVGGVMHGALPYTRPQLALLQKIYSNLEDPDGLAGVSSLRSHLLRSISDAQEDSTLPMQSRTALLDVSVAHTGQAGAAAGDQGVSQEEAPEGPGAAVQQSSLSLAPTLLQLQENIIDFESAFRWDDALMAYDQALAILPIREGILHTSLSTKSSHSVGVLSLTRASCHVGALHCLIQLGQEHTAFLRAQAVLRQSPSLKAEVFPVAVELAWRLQRWPDLQRLLDSSSAPSGREPYRVAMARAMLGVWRLQQLSMQHDSSALKASSAPFSFVQDTSWLGDWSALPGQGVEAHPNSAAVMRPGELLQAQVRSSLVVPLRPQSRAEVLEGIHKSVNNAVLDVMASLSAAAAESHTRAYPHLARLHCLWELLQATMIGREVSAETFPSSVLWPQRLRCTLPLLSSREPIHTLRRVIFSMHGLTNAVGDSLIQLAADARAAGGHTTATAALLRASHIPSCKTAAQVEMAKLLYSEGQHDRALAILEPAEIDLEALSSRAEACEDDSERERLLTPMLLATQWLAKGHRTDEHIYARYQTATQAVRTWEEAWYVMGRFQEDRLVLLNTQLHDLLQTAAASSDRSRELRVQEEKLSKQRDEAIVKAVKFYAKCLFQAKQRHTHESLPKVLTMYFDYGAALARAEEGASTTSVVGVTATGSDKIKRPSSSTFSTLHLMMNKLRSQMGGFLWMLVVPQLASRICHRNRDCATFLVDTLKSLTNSYWRRMVWTIVGLASSKKVRLRKERATQVIKQLASEDKVGSALKVGKALASALIAAAELKPADGVSRVELSICNKRMLASVDIALPTQDNLMLPLSVDPGGSLMVAESAVLSTTSNIVTIQHFESAGQVMSSKEKPKRITCVGSDGKRYYFLCKQERRGDLRKDARMMEYCVTSNRLWRASPDCQRRGVSMSTYAVTCLNEVCGIMEWLGNTSGFRGELTSIYRSLGEPDPVLTTRNVRRQYEALQSSSASMDEKVTKYRSRILPRFTPVFHKWFLRKFSDPSAWFEARLQFSRSAAAWSMAGHIIGLGDRHGENLLLNTRTGACCHVDFDCIFDKGLTLSIPEIVPFRASPNMLDGMGITGYEGVFRRASEACMHTLRESQGILLAQLESFIHDPLVEWSRADGSHSARAAAGAASDAIPLSLVGGERVNFNGVRMVARIEQRLQGHYNIGAGFSEGARPRPSQRSRPGSARASASDLSRALAPDGTPLNVAGQVDRLLKEATSDQRCAGQWLRCLALLVKAMEAVADVFEGDSFEDAEWEDFGDASTREVVLFSMEWDSEMDLENCIVAAGQYGGPIAVARNPHKMTAYFGDGDKDDVRIFTPAGQLLGAAKPADSSLGGANNVAALHWTPSEMLVVVREDGAVDTFNLHGEREGEAFPLSSALGGYLVLHTAMSGYTLAAVLVPGALSGQGAASGPELVVVPDVRRPSTRESSDLGLLGGGAPTSMTLLGALHAPSRKAEVIMSTTSSSLLVASAPHYEPEDQRLQQVFGTPILDLAVSPSGRLLACFGENGILFVVTTDMRKKVLQFDTQCSARGMPPPHQLLWVGGSPARITADANEALDFAVALVWHENGIIMVNPHTGEDAKVDVVEPLFAVQEVDCLRFFTSENHSMVQQVPPSIVNVLSISSESPARLLRDASTDFARRDAACDDDIRYLQSEGHLHDAVLDCIDGAVRHWLPERQKELLRAASYGKRFDVDFSAEVLTTAVKCLRTLNQLRSPEVAMPLTARQFDILTPEAVLGRLLLRSQHALALGMAEYWPLPALRSRVVEHWACAKIRREACVRPHKAITDEISSRLREARLTSCPYSKAAYSLGEGSASRSSGLAVSYADMAAAAQAVGQQELATSLLKLEPRAAEQVPLLLQMGAGAEALQRALESGDMDLVYLSLLHLKQSMSLQAGH